MSASGNCKGNAANARSHDGFETPQSSHIVRNGQCYSEREILEHVFGRMQDAFGHWEMHALSFGSSEFEVMCPCQVGLNFGPARGWVLDNMYEAFTFQNGTKKQLETARQISASNYPE